MIYKATSKSCLASECFGKGQKDILPDFNCSYRPRSADYKISDNIDLIFLVFGDKNSKWNNKLSDDGLYLYESIEGDEKDLFNVEGKYKNRLDYRITFVKDLINKGKYYTYIGVFKFDNEYDYKSDNTNKSLKPRLKYTRIQNALDSKKFLKNLDENNLNKTILEYLYPLYLEEANYNIKFKIKDQLYSSIAINNTSLNNKIQNIFKINHINSLYNILNKSIFDVSYLLHNDAYYKELIKYIRTRLVLISDKTEMQINMDDTKDIQKSINVITRHIQPKSENLNNTIQEVESTTINDLNNISIEETINKELDNMVEPIKNDKLKYNKYYNEEELNIFLDSLFESVDRKQYDFVHDFVQKLVLYIKDLEKELNK